MKKVLIITYYWPPSGGSGVQRWLKFVKYLPEFGWEPVVFTPENPSFEIKDESLLSDVSSDIEVIRFPIWEPYTLFSKMSGWMGKKYVSPTDVVKTGKKNLFQKVTTWIRGNVFIPDARIFWVKPSASFIPDILKSNQINTIITTGPPHSLHLIGLRLKKKYPDLHWIVDLRDPWSEWDFLDTLSISSGARKEHQKLERKVLASADRVITIAPFHAKRFEELGGRKVDLITNGYDEDDFKTVQKIRTSKFTIRHIGMVDELRDPRPFMQAVERLAKINPVFLSNIKIEFIGFVNDSFKEYVKKNDLLSSVTVFRKQMPHDQLLKLYGETDIQLLVLAHTALAPGNLPGKLFEYLASGNFIFGIGPDTGDAAEILSETHAGIMIERASESKILEALRQRFDFWKNGEIDKARNVAAFSRRQLTEQLVALMNKL